MAEISTYKCSNRICSFVVRISHDFPLWHADTPQEWRRLSVAPHALPYVVGRRDEALCTKCHSVVAHTPTGTCVHCSATTVLVDTHTTCPRCQSGTFALTHLSVF